MTAQPNGGKSHSRQASVDAQGHSQNLPLSAQPQPHASTSKLPMGNPQLGPEPFFVYPTPSTLDVEDELPPGFDGENVPLGVLLDRVVRKSYGELRGLTEANNRQKPEPIIKYAKSTRQSILKYLAVLRWKAQVDVPIYATPASPPGPTSFPTPHSSNGSDSPAYTGKGKGKATDVVRGKVTDAKRIEVFMAHQNAQHAAAVEHLRHTSKVVDGLRLRNPDLLTAMSVLSLGTYPRLPLELTETFLPKPPLTNSSLISTLRKLNRHIRYRLKCIDYVPPDLSILNIKDGRVYVEGSAGQWRAELTIINFGQDVKADEGRWWLTGVEWGWREKEGIDDPIRRLEGEERKAVLDLANMEVLPKTSDAPLVRIYNFLQHLCLTYQLEVLYTQAMVLASGKWRGQLSVDLDRAKKVLTLRYWLRPRPPPPPATQTGPKRPNAPVVDSRQPLVGATLALSLHEDTTPRDEAQTLLADVRGDNTVPDERLLRLKLGVTWTVGEIGEGAGWKNGDILNSSDLLIKPDALSIADILQAATTTHAAHLTSHHCTPLLSLSRISIFPFNPPIIMETSSHTRPVILRVPLPGRSANLNIGISALSGLIEIEDEGASVSYDVAPGRGMEDRGRRAKMASASVNEGKTRLGDDVGRLITAIITENIESQMRGLGYKPTRRLPLRSQDMAKADLHPASTIFLNLPTSSTHHIITKITSLGIAFEVLRLVKVQAENGVGIKLGVGERTGVELGMIRARRNRSRANGQVGVEGEEVKTGEEMERRGKRKFGMDGERAEVDVPASLMESAFVLDDKDIRDVFVYSNALVAQSIIESQLKSRQIPYTLSLPPSSGPGAPKSNSAIAGLVPTFTVNSSDLLKDGKAGDVAMPRVYMQIKGWWMGGKCSAVTVVQLRHRSSAPSTIPESSPLHLPDPSADTSAKAEGISFDQASSVVRFQSDDLDHCVPGFLEQWERLSKVIIVAGAVNKINKLPQFHNVRMLSFDLRTAVLEYYPGYLCSVTYDSHMDGYVVTFGTSLTSTTAVDNTESTAESSKNPHEQMAGLLSWELNELVQGQKDVGPRFIGLLRATLPFLLELESISQSLSTTTKTSTPKSPNSPSASSPKLAIFSIRHYRIIFDSSSPPRRYGVDVVLTPNDQNWIMSDLTGSGDGECGKMSEIKGFKGVVGKVWDELRAEGEVRDGEEMGMKGKGERVKAVKLDEGEVLMIDGEEGVVRKAVRAVIREVEGIVG